MKERSFILIFIVTISLLLIGSAYALSGNVSVMGRSSITGNMSATNLTGNGSSITSLDASQLTTGTIADARLSGNVVTTAEVRTLNNKTITASSNNVTANFLRTSTGSVDVSGATAPTAGQYLKATSSTAASWNSLPITGEITSGTTASLTTIANQRVLVWAKGDITTTAIVQLNLRYNNITQDAVSVGYTSSIRFPFEMVYAAIPGAATQNITVTTTGGTLNNVKIMVLKVNQ